MQEKVSFIVSFYTPEGSYYVMVSIIRLSVRLSVRPLANLCPVHNFDTIRPMILKLHRCVELIARVCRAQEP